jgi:hypothetical protein
VHTVLFGGRAGNGDGGMKGSLADGLRLSREKTDPQPVAAGWIAKEERSLGRPCTAIAGGTWDSSGPNHLQLGPLALTRTLAHLDR